MDIDLRLPNTRYHQSFVVCTICRRTTHFLLVLQKVPSSTNSRYHLRATVPRPQLSLLGVWLSPLRTICRIMSRFQTSPHCLMAMTSDFYLCGVIPMRRSGGCGFESRWGYSVTHFLSLSRKFKMTDLMAIDNLMKCRKSVKLTVVCIAGYLFWIIYNYCIHEASVEMNQPCSRCHNERK